jgi:hypothetical protein
MRRRPFPRLLELADRAQPQVAPPREGALIAVRFQSITFDCADPYRLAQFWAQVTVSLRTRTTATSPATPQGLPLS